MNSIQSLNQARAAYLPAASAALPLAGCVVLAYYKELPRLESKDEVRAFIVAVRDMPKARVCFVFQIGDFDKILADGDVGALLREQIA